MQEICHIFRNHVQFVHKQAPPTIKIFCHHGWQQQQWQQPPLWFEWHSTILCSSALPRQEHNRQCQLCQEKLPFPPNFWSNQNLTAQHNLPHCHPQSTNGSDNDINHIVTIYRYCLHYQTKLQDSLTQYDLPKVEVYYLVAEGGNNSQSLWPMYGG